MSEQESERLTRQPVSEPPVAKSPEDGSVSVKRPAAVGDEAKEFSRASPQFRRGPPPMLARIEKSSSAARANRMTFEALERQCKKNTEDIRALKHKYEELLSTVEALWK
ncbi:hypothetical protein FPHYL_2402 [Fusarium phyllophilum]|uniref:Uncharacterized protein n=1 Tax=Fusarium phyllophilum TaxID=47803 RepID=A0A8H5KAQ3_9HYPO|nr:hypothetical protein FPHYL_2402 [Fusarium phyllophilum]